MRINRKRGRSSFPRPYIWRFTHLRRFTLPSVLPFENVAYVSSGGEEGAEAGCDGITKKDARLAPGDALFNERELLASEGVKGMGDGKNLFPILAIRYSRDLTRPDRSKGTSIGSS